MSEWISVWDEENYPEIGVDVLLSDGESVIIGHYCKDETFRTCPEMTVIDEAVYWAPLPEPPQ